jgi:hypothetical protein
MRRALRRHLSQLGMEPREEQSFSIHIPAVDRCQLEMEAVAPINPSSSASVLLGRV